MNINLEMVQNYNNFLSFIQINKEIKMSEEIKEGDIVTLKTGTTKMIVGKIQVSIASCTFEDSNGNPKTESFYLNTLKKTDL